MFKSEKGMTLVTLLLAIIVLLAMTGAVLFLVFGKNGIAADNPVVIQVQDRNYVKSIVNVGLKAVRSEVNTTSTNVNDNASVPIGDSEKMDLLMTFLGDKEFTKESDTIITYKNDHGINFKITLDFIDYTIKDIE